jgi:hypothetical protein
MTIDIQEEIEVARRSWELSKYTDEELAHELYLRKKLENSDDSAKYETARYEDKDVIDFDDFTGEPFNSDTEGHLHQ